ncbi:hypothetical protein H6802_03610 [Candidatus Nomurabacteria bacterium]|uniref:Uncharacterized protein n=1 Tax=candidate division WWE3 bacterium TaxID=2053526 RepID=A0A955E1B7_UNCKA|nr:hypothetical protein [candidate division WWE3 bacterium]MCB9824015.1 hypothetical protein [Candidatus Nomurabacteria bacterium]MCB9827014.1 hypothetical protein [Candidatus Nomurabacteria bacterium]MCB9827956.1 hypothetical protein [Candidatus Nomurabacteria bacterium]HXK52744.1 hypothetical protein [bacterium]
MSSYTDGAKSGKAEQLGVADLYSFFQRYAEGETVTQDILFPPLYVDRELLFCRIISDESGPRLRVLKFTGETYDYSISSRGEGELVLMSALGPNSSGVIAYASQCAIYRRGAEAGENSAHLTNFLYAHKNNPQTVADQFSTKAASEEIQR